jgi:hydrogenase expression/formation protein HypD
MPKERIDHAYILAMQPDTILVTLGDMIKVPGSYGSLQRARERGADVRFVYSPIDTIKIAKENPQRRVIFFAIGFETTTPMTAVLIEETIRQNIPNLLFHINHVTVPEVMEELLSDGECKVDAFLGPAHVSVITGSKIYDIFPKKYFRPLVVAGFEPVDVMEAILKLVRQFREGRCEVEVQYRRAVTRDGNLKAQNLIEKYFEKVSIFRWRGLGDIPQSGWRLKTQFDSLNAEKVFENILPSKEIDDHKLCICGDILKGIAKPFECPIFGKACKPNSPIGSCMVSSEGACSAYYKYGSLL